MSYGARIGAALLASLLLNLALLVMLPHAVRGHVSVADDAQRNRAIRLDFRTPDPPVDEEDRQHRLIDPGAATNEPVDETDLISSQDSQAQDQSESEGDPSKPAVDEIDDFEEMPVPPVPPSMPEDAAELAPPLSEEIAEPAPPAPSPPPTADPPEPAPGAVIARAEPQQTPADALPLETEPLTIEEIAPPEEPAEEPVPERFQVAEAAPPSAPLPVQELRTSRGREDGGASDSGFTSFEANRHELGEYMLLVRKAVEREWRAALRLRYTGIARTEAVIECSIRPDGTLEYARVVDPGQSLTYAVMCRQAIEQAAPFGPFPFTVPEIYRKDNLEITWKFSYL